MVNSETSVSGSMVFCSEAYFQKLLINEREKFHESRRAFMLTVLDVETLLNNNIDKTDIILKKLSHSLHSSTRSIDFKGWYSHNALIGIIRPDLMRMDKKWVINNMTIKLNLFLDPQEAAAITMYHMFYPEYTGVENTDFLEPELDIFEAKRREFFYS